MRNVSLILGVIFFLFLLFGHLPARLQNHPEIRGFWIDAIKIFALSGGAFVLASAYPHTSSFRILEKLNWFAPAGRYFFAFMLLIFGYGHLVSAEKISGLVPKYIPWPVFWSFMAGVALVGSGISLVINVKVRAIALLLGIVLFIWFASLHLYYAIRFPHFQDGENIIGSFECLAFCGIALLLSSMGKRKITQRTEQAALVS